MSQMEYYFSIISIFFLNVMLLERYPNTVCKTYFFFINAMSPTFIVWMS